MSDELHKTYCLISNETTHSSFGILENRSDQIWDGHFGLTGKP